MSRIGSNCGAKGIRCKGTQLEDIHEEEEMLLGINVARKRDGSYDRYRAPRMALALFLLVCFGGVYRSLDDYLVAKKQICID